MPLAPITVGPVKFGRSYQMLLTGKSNTSQVPNITVGFPTTLTLDITHNIFASANVANFSLKGLSALNRSEISYSTYTKLHQYPILLRAGYITQQSSGFFGAPSSLPIIFDGFAHVAYTERQGPDLVTQINAFDNGDITNNSEPAAQFGLTGNSYTATIGTSFPAMVRGVMGCFPRSSGIKPGQVVLNTATVNKIPANSWTVTGKDRPFTGRVWEALEQLAIDAGAYVYIENGVCNMLGPKDVVAATNSLAVLQSSTGLLGIPKYTDATILCSMIFEPSMTIGAQLELNSSQDTGFNGPCRVVAYSHRGTISAVESGDLTTELTLMKLTTPLGAGVLR